MPIPITLQIPTIIKYNKNVVYRNSSENLIIKGTNFDTDCVVYVYNTVNFLSGYVYTPNFFSSTELRINNIVVPQDFYSIIVYNTVTELYSNPEPLEVKNSIQAPPQLFTNEFYTSGIRLNTNRQNIESIFTNNSSFPTSTPGINPATFASNTFGNAGINNQSSYGGFLLKFAGINITPDTIFLIKDGVIPEKYYLLSYDNVYGIYSDLSETNIQHIVNNSSWHRYTTGVIANTPPVTPTSGNYTMNNEGTTTTNNVSVYIPRLGMPYGSHFLIAVNGYGVSNQIQFELTSNQFSASTHNNVENDTHYDYEIGSCSTLTTLTAIDNKPYKIDKYLPFLFSNPVNIRKRVYTLKTSIFNPWDIVNVFVIDANQTCAALNCVANDVFPIGAGTSKFTTGQSTIFNTQCPVEVIGLQGTGTNGPTPLWDAWKMYSSAGASPAIPICGEQGEFTKTYTIEFASKVVAANLDITAQIVSATSNSMNVTIERWNHLTSTYEVIVNNVSTGSWTVGSSITKTIAIPVHTSTYKYRIAMTVLTDTSLNPTHLLKTAKLY